MSEQNRLSLYCSADNIDEFVEACRSCVCLEKIESESKNFIRELREFLNNLHDDEFSYEIDTSYGVQQAAEAGAKTDDG